LIAPRDIAIGRLVRVSDGLLDAALGLDDTLAYLAAGTPEHSIWQALAAQQIRIAEAVVNTLREDAVSGQARLNRGRDGARGLGTDEWGRMHG